MRPDAGCTIGESQVQEEFSPSLTPG